jgi:hypothetical protein
MVREVWRWQRRGVSLCDGVRKRERGRERRRAAAAARVEEQRTNTDATAWEQHGGRRATRAGAPGYA